jgi:hypothetical protein
VGPWSRPLHLLNDRGPPAPAPASAATFHAGHVVGPMVRWLLKVHLPPMHPIGDFASAAPGTPQASSAFAHFTPQDTLADYTPRCCLKPRTRSTGRRRTSPTTTSRASSSCPRAGSRRPACSLPSSGRAHLHPPCKLQVQPMRAVADKTVYTGSPFEPTRSSPNRSKNLSTCLVSRCPSHPSCLLPASKPTACCCTGSPQTSALPF